MWNRQESTVESVDVKTCPYCAEEIQEAAVKCKHCHSWIGNGKPWGFAGDGTKPSAWRLTRSTDDRKIFGVCGGVAKLLGLDPTIVRVLFAVACAFTIFVPGMITYGIMAWVI